jgi:type VI secretion system protein ImpC
MAEEKLAPEAGEAGVVTVDEFEQLLNKDFKPRSDEARKDVEGAVRTLAVQALVAKAMAAEDARRLPDQAVNAIRAMIADIDLLLSAQVNAILHHPRFQKLEGAWRGLQYLCKNTETGTDLKIRVMNISKDELADDLSKFQGTDWDQSPMFRKIYTEGYGVLNGDPVACIVGRTWTCCRTSPRSRQRRMPPSSRACPRHCSILRRGTICPACATCPRSWRVRRTSRGTPCARRMTRAILASPVRA